MNIWRLLSQLDDDKCSGTLVLLERRKNKEKLMADGSKVSSQFIVFTRGPIRLQFGAVQIPFLYLKACIRPVTNITNTNLLNQ